MIRKILCFIGIHNYIWKETGRFWPRSKVEHKEFRCHYCNKFCEINW